MTEMAQNLDTAQPITVLLHHLVAALELDSVPSFRRQHLAAALPEVAKAKTFDDFVTALALVASATETADFLIRNTPEQSISTRSSRGPYSCEVLFTTPLPPEREKDDGAPAAGPSAE